MCSSMIYTTAISMRILMICLWLIMWSLGSVVMTRFSDGVSWNKLRGFLFGYSQCPACHHRLMPTDLVPVLSYLVQWGKCRYCGKKIPRIYPVLELLCAWIFLLSYFLLKDFWTLILIFWLLTNRLLILLFIYDLQTYELHMIVWYLLLIVWILANLFVPWWKLRYALVSTIFFGGAFVGVYFFGKRYAKMRFKQKEWFGEGDIYIAITIWMFVPLLLALQWIMFSWEMMISVLILFVLLSSIIGLIRAWLQYLSHRYWTYIIPSSALVPGYSTLKVIPFFPAMIIAFWIIVWKLPYFITLLFG